MDRGWIMIRQSQIIVTPAHFQLGLWKVVAELQRQFREVKDALAAAVGLLRAYRNTNAQIVKHRRCSFGLFWWALLDPRMTGADGRWNHCIETQCCFWHLLLDAYETSYCQRQPVLYERFGWHTRMSQEHFLVGDSLYGCVVVQVLVVTCHHLCRGWSWLFDSWNLNPPKQSKLNKSQKQGLPYEILWDSKAVSVWSTFHPRWAVTITFESSCMNSKCALRRELEEGDTSGKHVIPI
jgi:hypothetical protein